MVRTRFAFALCLLFISILLLTGCTEGKSANGREVKQEPGNESKQNGQSTTKRKIQNPIPISNGELGKIAGWIDDETIVYYTNFDQGSSLYTYNIFSGKSEKVLESPEPILEVIISPSREKLLIHSSSSSEQGIMTVINDEGKILTRKTILSSELAFVWNSFNEDRILVTSFDEQWDFTVSILHIQSQEFKESLLTKQPFAVWLTSDEWLYLDWDLDDLAFFAPVIKQNTAETKVEQVHLTNVFQLFAFQDVLLTLSIDGEDKNEAVYSFYSNQLKLLQTFKLPQLTRYADWLIPFHDFNDQHHQFITFRPLSSGSADTYKEGFQLVRYHLDVKKEEVILEDMENKPIQCSPNGDLCLYGYQFENIIDLRSKKTVSMVKE
ncbi:hypothetical protein [Neobacillus sp. LXY-4]|uniref:YqgU-like beta propeller domain-containing protein n=1 Tax=Neobacillus sp. LXY-4 TaxID=3379826 RepID=UPI003EDE7D09